MYLNGDRHTNGRARLKRSAATRKTTHQFIYTKNAIIIISLSGEYKQAICRKQQIFSPVSDASVSFTGFALELKRRTTCRREKRNTTGNWAKLGYNGADIKPHSNIFIQHARIKCNCRPPMWVCVCVGVCHFVSGNISTKHKMSMHKSNMYYNGCIWMQSIFWP